MFSSNPIKQLGSNSMSQTIRTLYEISPHDCPGGDLKNISASWELYVSKQTYNQELAKS